MGDSKYTTPYQLWNQKIQAEPVEMVMNPAMQRGHDFEPRIRALFNMLYDRNFEPALCESSIYNFMKCSLDGKDSPDMIEIKTANRNDHEGVKNGILPKQYKAQVQHCLFVSGLKKCYYISYYDPDWNKQVSKEFMEVIEIFPDIPYQTMLLEECQKFWKCVLEKTPPKCEDKDFVPLDGADEMIRRWRELDVQIDELAAKQDILRKSIVECAQATGYARLIAAGVKISKMFRAGNINYSAIPELANVNLEKYRKPETNYWKMEIINEKV
jgi:putative phage-type endonuclease